MKCKQSVKLSPIHKVEMKFTEVEHFPFPGIPEQHPKAEEKLFLSVEEDKAQQILDVLAGTRICWALSMLDRCKLAILQHRIAPPN